MRIAVFSDLHGNPFACQVVLKAISSHKACDAIVVAGDICLGGSDPAACVDMLRSENVEGIYGNTELYILHPDQAPQDETHLRKWNYIQPVAYWVGSQLSQSQMGWLRSLPFERRFSPTGSPEDDLLVVHANPRDVELMIFPPEDEQSILWGQVRQPDDDSILVSVLRNEKADLIAFGHYHMVYQRRWKEKLLVNVASCSLPGVDHDWRARFTIFEWLQGVWVITRYWAPYDTGKELAGIKTSNMPSKEFFLSYFG